jgi:MinD-like ATPase involved in chromosome partitioning or flagellar assembly
MITLCWSAKGGSGTTTVAAAFALSAHRPTLLVDLAGDAALALGVAADGQPTLAEWFSSDVGADRLVHLRRPVTAGLELLPTSAGLATDCPSERWRTFGAHLRELAIDREVIVDVGARVPPATLTAIADRSLLVTRRCYLAVTHAQRLAARPTGIVIIDEPGRALTPDDVAASIGAPIVATLLHDPKIARAVDSGLAVSRLPRACLEQLRVA